MSTRPMDDDLRGQAVADVIRSLRLLFAEIEASPSGCATLERGHAIYRVAERLFYADANGRASNRTAVMTLRDLVWRVDSVRYVLAERLGADEGAALLCLLDTTDVHDFLRQEPRDVRP